VITHYPLLSLMQAETALEEKRAAHRDAVAALKVGEVPCALRFCFCFGRRTFTTFSTIAASETLVVCI
jgi:hypothetical protein